MSRINVIHVVNGLTRIDFGIWNSALFATRFLKDNYDLATTLLVCHGREDQEFQFDNVEKVYLDGSFTRNQLTRLADQLKLEHSNTLIVSHGCWLMPSRVGSRFAAAGYRWLYVPHGMLEPWSLSQGRLKKWIYFHLIEKRITRQANATRAVSEVEKVNLESLLGRRIDCVENGVIVPASGVAKSNASQVFLFMARLHYKKGILPLVKAWREVMAESPDKKLIIVGPDEGELDAIKFFLQGNIEYVGAVYGARKQELLEKAHFYVLPSHSEGFPTSVLEAMSFGAVPIISPGCNLPEAFENGPGIKVQPEQDSIAAVLRRLKSMNYDKAKSEESRRFVENRYSEPIIAARLNGLYERVLAT